jgi:hypothetical protein
VKAGRDLHATIMMNTGRNPTNAFIFGDGMTKWAVHTSKYRQRLSKKETAFFENRVFGVEIHCGPISGEILIHTNDLVRGGANFVIEVQRRGTIIIILSIFHRRTYNTYLH